ncbi:MAG: DNA-3-methyladenine glycosylase [Planctomycetota bacterium]
MSARVRARRLDARFFARDAPTVARELLGCVLLHRTPYGVLSGRVVETEAYLASGDPASHSFRGPTSRNASMFERGGIAYVYRIYGMHHCFNVVTGNVDEGAAVLVRALEPLAGLEVLRRRRGVEDVRALCSGPAKLVQALAIGPEHDGVDLVHGALGLWSDGAEIDDVQTTTRIGITKGAELPLRFLVQGSPYVSRRTRS